MHRKLIAIVLALVLTPVAVAAGVSFSGLPTFSGAPNASDIFPIDHGGATYQMPLSQLLQYTQTWPHSAAASSGTPHQPSTSITFNASDWGGSSASDTPLSCSVLDSGTPGTQLLSCTGAGTPQLSIGGGYVAGSSTYGPNGATVNGTVGATLFSGSGASLSNIPAATALSGVLPVANGGNGTSTPSLSVGSNLSTSGSWPSYTITFSASPSLTGATLTGLTASSCVRTNSSKALASASGDCVYSVTANSSNIVVGGTSTAPTIDLGSTPSITGLTLSGLTASTCLRANSSKALASASGDCVYSVTANSSNIVVGGTSTAPTIDLGSTPSITGLTLSGLTASTCLRANSSKALASASGDCVYSVTANSSNIVVGGTSTAPTIDLASSPSITGITLSGLTASRCVATNSSSALTSAGTNCAPYPLDAYASWSNESLTSNAYITSGTLSITTGVSNGATGAWRIAIEMWTTAGTTASTGCIIGTAAGINGTGTASTATGTACVTSPTSALAGAPNAASVIQRIRYSAQYANSSTYTWTCQSYTAGSSVTQSGGCEAIATPI